MRQFPPAKSTNQKRLQAVASRVYGWRICSKPKPNPSHERICVVCVSDTHNLQPTIPEGDLLLHAGDLTGRGTFREVQAQLDWLDAQPHRYKAVIAGNHDLLLDSKYMQQKSTSPSEELEGLNWRSIHYLQNTCITLHFSGDRSIKVFGSPLTPKLGFPVRPKDGCVGGCYSNRLRYRTRAWTAAVSHGCHSLRRSRRLSTSVATALSRQAPIGSIWTYS